MTEAVRVSAQEHGIHRAVLLFWHWTKSACFHRTVLDVFLEKDKDRSKPTKWRQTADRGGGIQNREVGNQNKQRRKKTFTADLYI